MLCVCKRETVFACFCCWGLRLKRGYAFMTKTIWIEPFGSSHIIEQGRVEDLVKMRLDKYSEYMRRVTWGLLLYTLGSILRDTVHYY